VQNLIKLSGASDVYDLEQQINQAVATPVKDRTALQRRLAYYAQYSTPEYRKWAKENKAEQAQRTTTVRGAATAGVGGGP